MSKVTAFQRRASTQSLTLARNSLICPSRTRWSASSTIHRITVATLLYTVRAKKISMDLAVRLIPVAVSVSRLLLTDVKE